MTKHDAKIALIRDICFAIIGWLIGTFFFHVLGELPFVYAMLVGLVACGIPFGWRWLSRFIITVSLQGFVLKLLGALLLGIIAIFVVLIGDVMNYIYAED